MGRRKATPTRIADSARISHISVVPLPPSGLMPNRRSMMSIPPEPLIKPPRVSIDPPASDPGHGQIGQFPHSRIFLRAPRLDLRGLTAAGQVRHQQDRVTPGLRPGAGQFAVKEALTVT